MTTDGVPVLADMCIIYHYLRYRSRYFWSRCFEVILFKETRNCSQTERIFRETDYIALQQDKCWVRHDPKFRGRRYDNVL
jgi:hypothetical protein